MIPAFYPGATQLMNGVGTGSWNQSGPWKLLLHTTESRGVPGYDGGQLAPHLTWNPVLGRWYQHFPFTRPAESLHTFDNDMVIQVEMICYSAKNIADQYGGLWVGALTDSQLNQLAGFCRWIMGHLGIPDVWPKKQALSYGQANTTGFRMSAEIFRAWSGLLGHQHAPYPNTHWDPGAFPWHRFMPLLQPAPTPVPGDDMTVEQFVTGLRAQPGQIDKLVDQGVIGIAPGGTTAQTKAYWRGKLITPEDPEWLNFIVAVQTAAALGGSLKGTWTT